MSHELVIYPVTSIIQEEKIVAYYTTYGWLDGAYGICAFAHQNSFPIIDVRKIQDYITKIGLGTDMSTIFIQDEKILRLIICAVLANEMCNQYYNNLSNKVKQDIKSHLFPDGTSYTVDEIWEYLSDVYSIMTSWQSVLLRIVLWCEKYIQNHLKLSGNRLNDSISNYRLVWDKWWEAFASSLVDHPKVNERVNAMMKNNMKFSTQVDLVNYIAKELSQAEFINRCSSYTRAFMQ